MLNLFFIFFWFQATSLNNKNFNYVQFLQEIATEHQFEVTYVDVEEKSKSGQYQCLVQLSTLPVAVCYGTGVSSKEAQSKAANNALEYLKIMTKKWMDYYFLIQSFCLKKTIICIWLFEFFWIDGTYYIKCVFLYNKLYEK